MFPFLAEISETKALEGCPDASASLSFTIFLNQLNRKEGKIEDYSIIHSINDMNGNLAEEVIGDRRNTAKFKENLEEAVKQPKQPTSSSFFTIIRNKKMSISSCKKNFYIKLLGDIYFKKKK